MTVHPLVLRFFVSRGFNCIPCPAPFVEVTASCFGPFLVFFVNFRPPPAWDPSHCGDVLGCSVFFCGLLLHPDPTRRHLPQVRTPRGLLLHAADPLSRWSVPLLLFCFCPSCLPSLFPPCLFICLFLSFSVFFYPVVSSPILIKRVQNEICAAGIRGNFLCPRFQLSP